MTGPTAKNIFALLCLLGVVAVATAAMLEVARMRRGESVISPRQFRLRLLSAVIWMILLGSTSYAMFFLWPERGDLEQSRRFLSVMSGVILLLLLALLLFIYDVWQFARQRRQREAQFQQQLLEMAQAEIQRAKSRQALAQDQSSPAEPPNPSQTNSGGQ